MLKEGSRNWLEHVTEKLSIAEEKAGVFRRVAEVPMWSCEVMFSRSRSKVSFVLATAGFGV